MRRIRKTADLGKFPKHEYSLQRSFHFTTLVHCTSNFSFSRNPILAGIKETRQLFAKERSRAWKERVSWTRTPYMATCRVQDPLYVRSRKPPWILEPWRDDEIVSNVPLNDHHNARFSFLCDSMSVKDKKKEELSDIISSCNANRNEGGYFGFAVFFDMLRW